MDEIYFDVDTAIPCGLIVNELITNCLKHAFPGDDKGEICIELLKTDDKHVLNVKDNGVGFPEDIDFKNTKSLGLQLVNNLVSQVDGTIELDGSNGSSSILYLRNWSTRSVCKSFQCMNYKCTSVVNI